MGEILNLPTRRFLSVRRVILSLWYLNAGNATVEPCPRGRDLFLGVESGAQGVTRRWYDVSVRCSAFVEGEAAGLWEHLGSIGAGQVWKKELLKGAAVNPNMQERRK